MNTIPKPPDAGRTGHFPGKKGRLRCFANDTVGALLVVAVLSCRAQADIAFSDGSFSDTDWSLTVFSQNASASASRQTTGGNPGSFRVVTLNENGPGFSSVYAYNISATATYDPHLGAITSLDWSDDARLISGFGNGEINHAALMQNGKYYYGGGGVSPSFSWTTHSGAGLTESQFVNITDSSHPDFSKNGAPISFGFMQNDNNGGSGTYSLQQGIDNWSVVLHLHIPIQPYKDIGCLSCQAALADPGVGDPIRLGNGNIFEDVTDYQTAGVNTLGFTRYYNSLGDSNTPAALLGGNWRSSYDRYLRITNGFVIAERADAQQLQFTNIGSGWISDSDVDIKLVQSGSTWMLTNSDDTVETYNTSGLLASIQSRDGYAQTLQYNGGNQLMSVSDSFGRTLQLAYQSNLLHTVTTPDGLVLTYGYNSSGVNPGVFDRLASVSYSTTPQTSQSYLYENASLPFALTGIIDENSNRFATWTYDSSGRAISSQHAGGVDLTLVGYDDNDGSRSITNALGLVTVYKFTTLQGVSKNTEIDRLATATTPAAVMTQTYDSNGYLASVTDWNTNITSMINDIHDQPLVVNEAVGTPQARTTTNTYQSAIHLPVLTVGPRKTTSFIYDGYGNLLTRTETDTSTGTIPYSTTGNTRSWTNTYDNLGHVLTTTGPRTDVTATTIFTYDTNGFQSTVTDPFGHLTQFTNNNRGLPLTMTDPNGVVTAFTYDARGRLITRTILAASGDATNSFVYDAAGDVTRITLPDGSFVNHHYDAAHRLQSTSNSLGESINYTLDAMGNIVQQSTLNGSATIVKTQNRVFDQLGRILQQIGASGQTNTFAYDANGNRLSMKDGLNHVTSQSFDALNRLLAAIDPLNNATGFRYDAQNNRVSVTDPRSLVTSYVYDGFGQVIQETSADKGTTVYTLDKAGNRISETDARGVVTLRAFDKLNRVTSETYPASAGENIAYSYDATNSGNMGIGRLTGYTDETGSTALRYNERGDVISTTQTIGGTAYITAYTYDLADHITGITYPSGDVIAYSRDSRGRIASVLYRPSGSITSTLLTTNVTYLPFGPLSGLRYGNGLTSTKTYDTDYRVNRITTVGPGTNVQSLGYSYDAANNIEFIIDNLSSANSQAFLYDADDRLTQAVGLYGTDAYTYDSVGNRLTRTAGGVTETNNFSSTANTLQSTLKSNSTRNFGYAPNGNLSSDNRGTLTNMVFSYGNRNRYSTLTLGGSTIATYKYNALDERLIKTAGPAATHYHYDEQGHLIAESQPNGTLIREYVWLDNMPLAQIETNGKVYFIHSDHLSTPQKMTDATQAVVWNNEGQPFGETVPPSLNSVGFNTNKQFQMSISGDPNANYIVQASTNLSSANWVSITTNAAPFTFTDETTSSHSIRFYRVAISPVGVTMNLRFPGQYYDSESGLNYNMHRDYDPTLGRYIQSDPIGSQGGINVYAYADANPINKYDIVGLSSDPCNFILPTFTLPPFAQPTYLPPFAYPTFTLPTFTLPTFTLPTFTQPTFTLPTFTLPTFTLPTFTLPTFALPTFAQPTYLPTFTLPTFTLPTFTQPTFTFPTFDFNN